MLSTEEKAILKNIARESILHGLDKKNFVVNLSQLPKNLREKKASFVTLTFKNLPENKNLKGCIGSIFPSSPLAEDVASNAYSAAFRDPRFSPLKKSEFPFIDIKISVLSPLEIIKANSLHELLDQIEPYKDGIYLKYKEGSATFLPDVWNKISDKEIFIQELYKKARLPFSYHFSLIRWYRYRTENF